MDTLFPLFPLLLGMPDAGAASGGAAGGQFVSLLVTFGLIIVIFYFLIIRPQNKKQKDTKRMLEALKKGDRIVTIGGLRGTIHSVKQDTVIVRVDGDTKLEFNRSAISTVVAQADGEPAAQDKGGKSKAKGEDKTSGNGTSADAAEPAAETEDAGGKAP